MAETTRPHVAVLVNDLPTAESVIWNEAFQAISDLEQAIADDKLFAVVKLLTDGGYGELAGKLAGDAQKAQIPGVSTSA
jgi:hypothetical protein